MVRRRSLIALALILVALPVAAQTAAPATPFGLLNGTEVAPGVLSAGQPTAAQLGELAKAGTKTIIDLRTASEDRGFDEPARAKELGLIYVNIPVTTDTLDAATITRFREAFAKAERPLVLHCASANRVGALLYADLVLGGTSTDEALAKAKAAGLKNPALEEKIKDVVAQMPAKP